MPDEDFIKAYTQGRIPRRAFVRRLVAGGLSLSAALAYGSALAPATAEQMVGSLPEHRPLHGSQSDHHTPTTTTTTTTASAAIAAAAATAGATTSPHFTG